MDFIETRITQGNIDNQHFYLTGSLDFFPVDTHGGKNEGEAAQRKLRIEFSDAETVHTDIDTTKRLFRARGWVRQLFSESKALEGDMVRVTRLRSHRYWVEIVKRERG